MEFNSIKKIIEKISYLQNQAMVVFFGNEIIERAFDNACCYFSMLNIGRIGDANGPPGATHYSWKFLAEPSK